MNLFRIMQSIRGWAQAGKIDFPGAVKYLTDLGVKMDGIVHQALKNVFKEGKARDPDFGNVVQKLPIDDQGIPFNPKTLKSTAEKRGIRGTSEADRDIAFIQEGIDDLNKAEREADLISKQGVGNLFDEKLPNVKMGSRMNYEKIADLEGIDVELIRGKNWSEIRAIIAAVRDKADGGRVGFVDGGWADDLTGPGLALYNSMTAGGHSDQAIQDTLTELGYWTPDGEATETVESIVGTDITQGGDNDPASGDNDGAIRLPPRKKTPTTDFNINPAAQLTGKGRIDPMGSTYDNLAMMGPMDYKTAGYHRSEIPGQEGYVQPDTYFEPPTGILQKAKRNVLDPIVTAAGAAFGVPLGLLTAGAELIGGMLPYNERAAMENQMLESGFALDDIGRIVATGDYNTPEGIMAGYNAAQMTADTFDKRMNKIRQSNWQNKVNQQARIDLIQQAKELWQGAKDDADKLNPVNIPFSGEGAQGGGGGTNIGGGQRGEPTREASYASYDRPGATGSPGYRWKDGGLATMFTRRG